MNFTKMPKALGAATLALLLWGGFAAGAQRPELPGPQPSSAQTTGGQNAPGEGLQFSQEHPIAPEFNLTDINGLRLSLHNYRGKVVLLDFWATWCPPCQEEVPEFVGLQTRYENLGLQVIGIATDDHREAVERFYRDDMMNYPVAMATRAIQSAYNVGYSLPTTYLIGRDGRIYARVVGAPSDPAQLEQTVHALLKPLSSYPPVLEAGAERPQGAEAPKAAATSRPAPETAPIVKPTAVPASATPAAPPPNLSDPSPAEIPGMIREIAAKETLFQHAFEQYTYHQLNKVETLDAGGYIDGQWQQNWDILYNDQGQRFERVTYAPVPNLRGILMTEQDVKGFRSIQPFVLTTADLPNYEVKYLSHVKLDYITAYVFSVRPKVIEKGREYFKGVIWVDDKDLQIVKTEGREVPQIHKKGYENLFPSFTTYRKQIDGKYWFPVMILADDTLYFSQGPVHIHEVVKFTDYKQFSTRTHILSYRQATGPSGKPSKTPGNQ